MKQTNGQAFVNCCNQMTENRKRNEARKLYQQSLSEPLSGSAPTLSYEYKGMWNFPAIDGNLTYHTAWGGEDCSYLVDSIRDVLLRFNLPCEVIGCTQGPTLSRFLLSPSGKTKVGSVTRLENDFKVSLNSPNVAVRVENGALVIDVPRVRRETVYFGDLVRSDVFQTADKTALAIGMDIELNPIVFDLRKAVHILIAGQTGSGKSVLMHNLVASLLMKNTPADLHLHIIDPKMLEFSRYDSLPHCSVTTEVLGAVKLLEGLCREMDNRYAILSQSGSRDIDSYNEAHIDNPMRREVVVIDELADLMNQCGKAVESNIARLAQKARACGIHLIVATQYPIRTVVTGLIKQNIPTRICLSVSSTVASMVALDMPGGEDLIGNGDMLFLANGSLKPVRLQGGYISEMEIANIVYALNQNVASVTYAESTAPQSQISSIEARQFAPTPGPTLRTAPAQPIENYKTNVCGITAIICGVIGIVFWLFGIVGLIFGIVAAKNPHERKGPAVVGLLISLFAILWPMMAYAAFVITAGF